MLGCYLQMVTRQQGAISETDSKEFWCWLFSLGGGGSDVRQ
jgi:hypothetical protein